MMEEKASKLFHDYIETMVNNGWKSEKVLPNAYKLTDNDGVTCFASCHIEGSFDRNRFGVLIKIDDTLAPIGTVAKVDNEWKIFPIN